MTNSTPASSSSIARPFAVSTTHKREEGMKNPTAAEWVVSRKAATCAIWARIYGPCPQESIVRRDCSALAGACAAEEKCGADLSVHAGQPRIPSDGCTRSQRTCRTDRGPRDGNCQHQGSIAESRGFERGCATAIGGLSELAVNTAD